MVSKLRASAIIVIVGLVAFWLGMQAVQCLPCDTISRFALQDSKTAF